MNPQIEWVTPDAAAVHFALPVDLIESAILDGDLTVRRACGARVIPKAEIEALALRLRAEYGGCESCE